MMATNATLQQQDLDNRIRDLTAQLADAHYERSRSQQVLQREQLLLYQEQPVYQEPTVGANNPYYATGAPVPSRSREPAPPRETAPFRELAPRREPTPTITHNQITPDGPPPAYSTDHLPLPVVLPQTSKNFRGAFYSPFVRAYVPELEAHDISQTDFLTFIDGLNEAFVANPVFEGLGVAGTIMQQFYGLHPVQWAGMGVQAASGLASAATSYARTRMYVKAINADLFHPSGLHVDIMTTKKMMGKVGHPEERLSLPPLETTDQLDNDPNLSLEASVTSRSNSTSSEDPRMRRVRALQGYVMPLDFDVPAAVTPDNVFKRMGNAQAKRQARKQEKKDDKRRDKALEKRDEKLDKAEEKIAEIEADLLKERRKKEKEMSKSKAKNDPKEMRKIERDLAKKERELKKEMEKAVKKREETVEKHGDRHGGKLGKADEREEKTANKIRWVVISVWDGEEQSDDVDEEESADSDSLEQSRRKQ